MKSPLKKLEKIENCESDLILKKLPRTHPDFKPEIEDE